MNEPKDENRQGPRTAEGCSDAAAGERERPQGPDTTQGGEPQADASAEKAEAARGAGKLPPPDFRTFLAGLFTQTLMELGEIENPLTRQKRTNLPEASYLIDTIDMLRDKTRGNLQQDEEEYLNALLHDLRLRYVAAVESRRTRAK
jgi:hypothetical protein